MGSCHPAHPDSANYLSTRPRADLPEARACTQYFIFGHEEVRNVINESWRDESMQSLEFRDRILDHPHSYEGMYGYTKWVGIINCAEGNFWMLSARAMCNTYVRVNSIGEFAPVLLAHSSYFIQSWRTNWKVYSIRCVFSSTSKLVVKYF